MEWFVNKSGGMSVALRECNLCFLRRTKYNTADRERERERERGRERERERKRGGGENMF
jgi:hypothetical protein